MQKVCANGIDSWRITFLWREVEKSVTVWFDITGKWINSRTIWVY